MYGRKKVIPAISAMIEIDASYVQRSICRRVARLNAHWLRTSPSLVTENIGLAVGFGNILGIFVTVCLYVFLEGGAENDGHEIAGHENDGPSCRA